LPFEIAAMKNSEHRIFTTHVGSLPRPAELLELANSTPFDEKAHDTALRNSVVEVVRRQVDAGLDVIDDGELASRTSSAT
jgi:5-methyltetrahydropteroyltriglutamate--homocysteine methyltransferase